MGASGASPRRSEELRPQGQLEHKAGMGRVAHSGLPHWDSRTVSFRTFLCHLY